MGPPGEPGDIRRTIHLASRVVDGYAQILEWTLEFRRLSVEPELEALMRLAAGFSANMLIEIETYCEELYGRVKHTLANHSPGEVVNFTLTLTAPDTAEFVRVMERVRRLP
jgi:hypothetical protein